MNLPNDFLDVLEGYESEKKIIRGALQAKKQTHVLLYGSPASGKSIILFEIMRLPNTAFALGGSSTKTGITEILASKKPDVFVIDEIEKGENKELSVLLSAMEGGLVSVTKHKKHIQFRLPYLKVFAACNYASKLPKELISRFLPLKFPDYTDEEAYTVMKNVLVKRENMPKDIAETISNKTVYELNSRNVRDAVTFSRLYQGGMNLDSIFDTIKSNWAKKISTVQTSARFSLSKDEVNSAILYLTLAREIFKTQRKLHLFLDVDRIIGKLKRLN